MVLKVATWNINSFRLRENLIVRAISEYSPDLICLQECKSPVEKMPFEALKNLVICTTLQEVKKVITV